jgi:hypothetical protein
MPPRTGKPANTAPRQPANGTPTNGHAASGTPILTEALRLNAKGFAVCPCNGKRAALRGWQEKRLTAEELRTALEGKRLNIALVLNLSGLIDVEYDTGEEGEAAVQALFAGAVPPTPTWTSKRGLHRLFRRPPGLPQTAVLEIEGVEFRVGNGKGALSVVPPSLHPEGHRYEWMPGLSVFDLEPAELPAAVVDRLRAPAPQPAPPAAGIPEGKRNDHLFRVACKLVRTGLDAGAVEGALLLENVARCTPPLSDEEVAAIAKSAVVRGKVPQTNAALLLELATADVDYWHSPDGTPFATISRDGHSEHWRVRSRDFKNWLSHQFYLSERTAVGSQTLADVLGTLEGRALFDGETHPVYLRVAGYEDRIYLDLADGDWRVIEVGAEGWRVIDNPPVRFRRTKGMLALPPPERGGSVKELRRFVNVTDDDWPLLLAVPVAVLRPRGPYPIFKFLGEQGCAKSTGGKVVRSLVDPNVAPLRRLPRSDRDLMIAASNGWFLAFDNLSYVPPDTSDALSSLATGGGFGTRALYFDDEEVILEAARPILLNGIDDPGARSDLLDRCVIVEMPRIKPGTRKEEEEFWAEFELARPRILGAFLDAVAAALRNLPDLRRKTSALPRMADFARWMTAAEPALGLEEGDFLAAYERSRDTANDTALDSSPVVPALRTLLGRKGGKYEGTATDLLFELSIGCTDTRARGWPKTPKVLSGQLRRLAPNLRQAGLVVEPHREKEKMWRIEGPAGPQKSSAAQTAAPQNTGMPQDEGLRAGVAALREQGQVNVRP